MQARREDDILMVNQRRLNHFTLSLLLREDLWDKMSYNKERNTETVMEKETIFKSMAVMQFFLILSVGLYGMIVTISDARSDEPVDHGIYAELLRKYVNDGEVDYRGLKEEESKLDQYLRVLEVVKPDGLSRDEQFAFYINAYNAWTLKLILGSYPGIKSIRDLGSIFKSPWEKEVCRINGRVLTLDEIEHDILRPRFRDPRVHFAVNCASKGCPPLRPEPYYGKMIDRQLNEMAAAFINNPRYNRIEGGTLYVSSIFKWYAEDFHDDIIGFFLKYSRDALIDKLEIDRDRIRIKYLTYDWSLNGK